MQYKLCFLFNLYVLIRFKTIHYDLWVFKANLGSNKGYNFIEPKKLMLKMIHSYLRRMVETLLEKDVFQFENAILTDL